MTNPLRCLLCNSPLPSFDPSHPNPEGHERSLLCENHPEKQLYEDGFRGLYGETDDQYQQSVREICTEVNGQAITQAWYTSGYFSLLFELSKAGLLLIYPLKMAAMVLYVPPVRRVIGSPAGLNPLNRFTLLGVKGSYDTNANTKNGLEGIVRAKEKALPLQGLEFGQNVDGKMNPWKLIISFERNYDLEVTAIGWSYGWGDAIDATDLVLKWRDGKEP
jgi:hypothetical protein